MSKSVAKKTKKESVTNNNNQKIGGLQLVDGSDMKVGRKNKNGNGLKYGAYKDAITPHVGWLREQIDESSDNIIRIRNKDVANAMGAKFKKLDPTSIYWGLKYTLYREGIWVTSSTNKSDEDILVMRYVQDGDVLPGSLNKYYQLEVGVIPDVTKKADAPAEVKMPDVQKSVEVKSNTVSMQKRVVTAMRVKYTPEDDVEQSDPKQTAAVELEGEN